MVPLGVMKQFSICLHSQTLSHCSIAAGFRGFQHCLKYKKRFNLEESGLQQDSFQWTLSKMIKTALFLLQQLAILRSSAHLYRQNFQGQPTVDHQLFTVHVVHNGQHIRQTVNCIPTSSSYRQQYTIFLIVYQFPLCQFPLCQLPTLSTSHFVNFPLCQFPLCQFPVRQH